MIGGTPALFVRAMFGLARAGALGPVRPLRWVRMLRAVAGLGPTPAAAGAVAAARDPSGVAVIDDWGAVTYGDLALRAGALASGLRVYVRSGERLGILCRNHRGFVEALLAGTRLGVDVVLLNTEFAAPQLGSVLAAQRVGVVLYDEEFSDVLGASGYSGLRLPCVEGDFGAPSSGARERMRVRAPGRASRIIVLTSGTTGTPKGAIRRVSISGVLAPVVAHLRMMPLRTREPTLVAPPLFHGFGLVYLAAALVLGTPLVLCRRFSAAGVLELVEKHRVRSLFVVPVMLQRLLPVAADHDVSSLRVVGCGAAPLSPALVSAAMDAFGDVLYNLYGSVEAGWGTVAGPGELRAAPGTVGRPPRGVVIRVLDASGAVLPAGAVGRVCVGGGLAFDGYTDGGASERRAAGPVDTGDLGHLDASGRLFIDGRADDMIVSGGENVFPQVVEECLAAHPGVEEVAVAGVPDSEFGQRLVAYVVPRVLEGPQSPSSEAELLAWIKARLARYQVPRQVIFVADLPRTATGKVQRFALPAD